jgi:TolB-like protein
VIKQARGLRATALLISLQHPWPEQEHIQDDSLLAGALVRNERFRFIDRDADALFAKEQALVEAGYVDRNTAARAGHRLAARYVIVGTLARGREDVECFVRLIQCETGTLVCTADAYASRLEGDDIERAFFSAVAGRLRQIFPVVEGHLATRDGRIELDVGQRGGVVASMLFHILPTEHDSRCGRSGHPEPPALEVIECKADLADLRMLGSGRCPTSATVISE